jgi:hypothetical protein
MSVSSFTSTASPSSGISDDIDSFSQRLSETAPTPNLNMSGPVTGSNSDRPSAAPNGTAQANVNVQAELWRIFTHYAMQGSNGALDSMSNQMFLRLMRDCGVMGNKVTRVRPPSLCPPTPPPPPPRPSDRCSYV